MTVITPSFPGREHMLVEAIESVYAQTVQPFAHLIRCQVPEKEGIPHIVTQLNALLSMVTTEWVTCLDDDDYYLPHHVETILPHLDHADVVYTYSNTPRVRHANVNDWSEGRLVAILEAGNVIAPTAAIRTQTVRELGGWGLTQRYVQDWDMWLRLALTRARFRCVPVETWAYRFHAGQVHG